jgi:hypothetical protein
MAKIISHRVEVLMGVAEVRLKNSTFSRMLLLYIIVAFLSPSFAGSALADGFVMAKADKLFYLGQDSQFAVIDYISGWQEMLISIRFPWEESNKTAWIFPLPSHPMAVHVDIVDGAPVFRGKDIVKEAKEDTARATSYFAVSYPLSVGLPWAYSLFFLSMDGGMVGGTAGLRDRYLGGDVTVHEHFEMYGFVVEVVSATGGAGFYNYLTDNGLEVSEGIVPQLDHYVEADYTFVVTWVSESGSDLREPGLLVKFLTDEMFYPLALTSTYGSDVIPMEIFVVGYVSPKIYDEIGPYTDVTYWEGRAPYSYGSAPLSDFIDAIRSHWDDSFTHIDISAPSSAFKEDLWIKDEVPMEVHYALGTQALFEKRSLFPTFLMLFTPTSLLVALLVGLTTIGSRGGGKSFIPYYLAMGAANLVGILGVWVSGLILGQHMRVPAGKIYSFVAWFSLAFFAIFLTVLGFMYLSLS